MVRAALVFGVSERGERVPVTAGEVPAGHSR